MTRDQALSALRVVAVSAMASAIACGGASHPKTIGDRATDGGFVGGGSSGDMPAFGADDPWVGLPSCSQETQYVYVVDSVGLLRRFDPPTVAFTPIGPLACAGSPFSMAVDRTAVAWVLFDDGRLARVDTRSGKCKVTAFVSRQAGFSPTFGMGFSSDAAGGGAETLFVSGSPGGTLAVIDTQSLALTKVADYDALRARAELTGTGDGRLFGAFEGAPYVVAEVDKATAHVVSQAPQTSINYTAGGSNFAFAFWGGDFYLFVGPGTSTDVFRYRPADASTTQIATVPFAVVGAGVSTCAPITGPK